VESRYRFSGVLSPMSLKREPPGPHYIRDRGLVKRCNCRFQIAPDIGEIVGERASHGFRLVILQRLEYHPVVVPSQPMCSPLPYLLPHIMLNAVQ